jgi:hypothetical protein
MIRMVATAQEDDLRVGDAGPRKMECIALSPDTRTSGLPWSVC